MEVALITLFASDSRYRSGAVVTIDWMVPNCRKSVYLRFDGHLHLKEYWLADRCLCCVSVQLTPTYGPVTQGIVMRLT